MKHFFLSLLIAVIVSPVFAQVDTVLVHSPSMNKDIKNVIVVPSNYDKSKKYPVVYLLHGHGGSHNTWITRTKPTLLDDVTRMGVIAVCPDAENSWYVDSPVDPTYKYETYITKELIPYMDKNYSTEASPKGRAVTGFSMGGYGGLWLGINHPELFGACGSMSGGTDILPYTKQWNLHKRFGNYKENPEVFEKFNLMNQVHLIEPGMIKIIIDCGVDDYFFAINEKFHEKLVYMKVEHDYITRPGKHTHAYWNNAIDYQFLFFMKHFNGVEETK